MSKYILPVDRYLSPFGNLQNGFLMALKTFFSFNKPYVYHIIGLIVGIIGSWLYRRDKKDDKDQEQRDLIKRLKEAKRRNNLTRDQIVEARVSRMRLQEQNKNDAKKEQIKKEILKIVNISNVESEEASEETN